MRYDCVINKVAKRRCTPARKLLQVEATNRLLESNTVSRETRGRKALGKMSRYARKYEQLLTYSKMSVKVNIDERIRGSHPWLAILLLPDL